MATRKAPRKQPNRAAATAVPSSPQLRFEYRSVADIHPYEWNPRDNTAAIAAVKKSIEQFGFVVPALIDDNGVLIAGHTRYAAAVELGMESIPVVYASHMNEDQVRAFRIVDNKVAEIADWDFDMLAREMSVLTDVGIDFTNFGFSQEEVDCLRSVVGDDVLNDPEPAQEDTSPTTQGRRAPRQTRVVVGEFVFFVPTESYNSWADGIRQLHDFDNDEIAADLRRRLGLPE